MSTLAAFLHLPRFAPDLERRFQEAYFLRVRATLRLVSGLLAQAIALYIILGAGQEVSLIGLFNLPQLALCLVVCGLTWLPSFRRFWQPFIAVAGCLTAASVFKVLEVHLRDNPPLLITEPIAQGIINNQNFTLQVCVFMVVLATFRLLFLPSAFLQCGIALVGAVIFWSLADVGARGHSMLQFLEPVTLVLVAVLLASYVQEKLARGALEYNRRLEEMQINEQARRVETENMLHILNGAIGGVVHDMGNPLTTVQTGAELTRDILRDGKGDAQTVQHLNAMVMRGAKMLSFLRLSLIEQSRVLEGKPVPLELKPASVRAIVEAGASFQQARHTQGTLLSVEGDDTQICADEMKMVTVFMNLIGNAFKYSDGEVCVTWERRDDALQIAVMDKGTKGQGVTKEQAKRLFTAFGRLDTHADVEGTGLGLLSVQKIVEAHGGQAWVEGFENGTRSSTCFSTRCDCCTPLFHAPYLTAFMVTCPLAS